MTNFETPIQLEFITLDYGRVRQKCLKELLGHSDYSEVLFNGGTVFVFELRNEVAKDTPRGRLFVDQTQQGNGAFLM